MPKRHDAQRHHIIDSLDNLISQLHAVSFFLFPSLLPLVCRVVCQFFCYKPREWDPKVSLRVWFVVLCLFNIPSVWSHATEASIEGRSVILDFVGLGYQPSKLHLLLLDALIILLQVILTTISYERSLHLSSPATIPDTLQPPSTSATAEASMEDEPYKVHNNERVHVLDLRITSIITRLRNPAPEVIESISDSLPLPNTTQLRFPFRFRASLTRGSDRQRLVQSETEPGDANREESAQRRIPGSMSTEGID
ncbi:hypothetical protein BJ138DRAFT_1170997 [Hygrophoropsis aurantiaca]|uniref:Uncharacterized protein n=1 Tax=Hygrophoropsis aurantiaca TaxID=72124 RepID=A0ACB8AKX7_9AGAM|nr:hypothetical protein BJ138DRAFT_1170997 [Hygrophoropsis aurantiaca]